MNSTTMLILAGIGAALTLLAVIKAFTNLVRKKTEERYLIKRLQKDVDIISKIKQYESKMIDSYTSDTDIERKNVEKLHESIIKEIEEEIYSYISKNKDKLRETKQVVSTSIPQRQRYLEKLLQKLVDIDITPKLKV